jgi:hypothetical protein
MSGRSPQTGPVVRPTVRLSAVAQGSAFRASTVGSPLQRLGCVRQRTDSRPTWVAEWETEELKISIILGVLSVKSHASAVTK